MVEVGNEKRELVWVTGQNDDTHEESVMYVANLLSLLSAVL